MLFGIIQASPIPMFALDRDHRVIHWNRALEKLSGVSAEEIIGTREQWRAFYRTARPCLADLLIDGATDLLAQYYPGRFARSSLIEEAYEVTGFFPDIGIGGRWLHFTAAPIRDIGGRPVGALETSGNAGRYHRTPGG